jgi:Tol biopolymer transport system component
MPERWATIDRLYHEALERDASERGAFLADACAGDDALRREVESLIAHDGQAKFLSTPALADEATLVGRVFGPYVISARIGEGGMGEVYRARDAKLGRDVAIKVLPAAFTSDPERLARFEREARMLAALNHPHIGAIYGVEERDGIRALVLELVDGPTLADRLANGPLPITEALRVAKQIAEALEAAHGSGIVHRDLKPANIKVTPAGVVKVLDFGLAKAVTEGAGSYQTVSVTVGGTRDGLILGTPAYMSPEQARGQVVDERTDVWAFGCVLYEMLTGRVVFSGATSSDTIAAIIEREPEWRALSDATPAGIRRLLERCLRKDPWQRLRHMGDARLEIEDAIAAPRTALDSASAADATVARKRGRGNRWIAAAAAVVIGVTLGAWAISRLRSPDAGGPVLRLQINPPAGGQFGRIGSGRGPNLAVSPDGKTVVYGATVDGKYTLWLHPLDGTAAHVLPGSEDASGPSWSPDGRYIAFASTKGKLLRIDAAGGTPSPICDIARIFGCVWMPDNRILLGVYGGTLATVPASGGTLSRLTTFDTAMADIAHVWPQLLPGGHFLYWNGSNRPENNGVIYAASFEKPNERIKLVTSDTSALYTAGPDGNGYLLWQRSGTLVAQEFDGARLRFSGEPRPIADDVGIQTAAAYLAVAVSSSGTLLYAPAGLFQLTWFDRTGKQLGKLGEPGQYMSVRFSPDGKQIATTRTEVGRELWLIDVEHGSSRRTTFDSRGGFFPQWAPDGRGILFIGDTTTALYHKDPSGVAPDERLASWLPEDFTLTDWSRDGRSILNTRHTVETQNDIWVVPVTPDGHLSGDGQPRPYLRTPVNEAGGRFSPEPNPRWIAYQSDESGRDEVYVQSFPEPHGPHRISTNGGTDPQWGPGGRELFYQSAESKVMAVSLKLGLDSVTASEPHELFALPQRVSFFEVTPDGKRFLVRMPDPTPHPLTVIVNWPSLLKSKATGQ